MDSKNFYCIIMAGGTGRRFWPYSRKSLPKQFLDFFGTGQTLLQQTYERYKQILPAENIFITTNQHYRELVLNSLPGFNESNLIVEEEHRNTAPAIAIRIVYHSKNQSGCQHRSSSFRSLNSKNG